MLRYTKWLLEDTEHDKSNLIAIHTYRFYMMVTALRTAVANECKRSKDGEQRQPGSPADVGVEEEAEVGNVTMTYCGKSDWKWKYYWNKLNLITSISLF